MNFLTMIRSLALAALLLGMCGCGIGDPNPPHRFTVTYIDVQKDGCYLKVLEDTATGCQYLQICNSVTSMPRTCRDEKRTIRDGSIIWQEVGPGGQSGGKEPWPKP
jgi:hypothetical protein